MAPCSARRWVFVTALLTALASSKVSAARLPGEYMNEMWTGYETPHVKWAKPYSQGRIKAFFIAPYTAAREVTELAQRLDLEVAGESTASDKDLGNTDVYNAQVKGTSPSEKKHALMQKLKQRYDVIVLANFDYALLPQVVQYRIAEQVTEGTGLVLVYRRNVRPEFFRHPDEAGRRFIASGVPFGGLAFYRDIFMPNAKLDGPDGIAEKLVGAYRVKQGRVVQVDFGTQSNATYGGFCLTPREYFSFRSQAEYEYHQMLIINAVVWAAKREPPVTVETPQVCRGLMDQGALSTDAGIGLTSQTEAVATVIITVRNAWGESEFEAQPKAQLAIGRNPVPVRLPQLCGGGHYLDIRVLGEKGALGWASFWLEVKPPLGIAHVKMDKLSFERSEPATGVVTLTSSCPAGCAAEVSLLDNYQRLYARSRVALRTGAKEVRFSVPLTNAISLAGRCRVKLMKGRAPCDQAEAEFFVPKRELDVYPALLWGTLPGIVGHWLNDQLRQAGLNAILLPHYMNPMQEGENGERRRISAVSRDDMLSVPYTTHISAWSASLGDDAAYEKNRQSFARAAEFLAPYGPLVYSLGDENCIPEKAGFDEADRPGFLAYLKREYPTLDALNAAWGTNLRSWEEATPIRVDEARKASRFAQYHDTETYREELYARWHRFMNDVFRSVDPHAKVGSEGSTPGDLEKTIAGLEFWGPYRDPVVNTLLRSLAPRSLVRGNWFGGYVFSRHDLGGLRRFLWDTFLDGNNLFEVYCCYTCENILNNDLTFGYWTEAFLPDMKEVVDGIGQLQMASEHDSDPVAVYYSQPSVHAAAFNPVFGDFHADHLAALTVLADAGYQPYYVTPNQVKAGLLAKANAPKAVFLPYVQSLSDEEAQALTKFVEAGGLLIADVAPGTLDEHCTARKSGALDTLLGVKHEGPARVLRAKLRVPSGEVQCGSRRAVLQGAQDVEVAADASATVTAAKGVGKVVGDAADLPAVIVNSRSKGAAVLLNFALSSYVLLDTGKRGALRDMAAALISTSGAKPFCRVLSDQRAPMLSCRHSRFRRGEIVSLGVLAPRLTPDTAKAQATLKLASAAHVYDQRTGRYFGFADAVPLTLDPTSATMLSLLPNKVEGLKVTVTPKVVAGGQATVSATILTKGKLQGHVLRLRVRDPKGKDLWQLARTLRLEGATATVQVPVAFNDPAGVWIVTVRDIATKTEKAVPVGVVQQVRRGQS